MLSDLRAFLMADDTISGLVGSRVYPNKLPENVAYPAIRYEQVSGVREYHLRGPSGRARPRISINAWATKYEDARGLADAIRRRLNGYAGTLGETEVGSIKLESEIDFFEDEVKVHRVAQDYMISFKET